MIEKFGYVGRDVIETYVWPTIMFCQHPLDMLFVLHIIAFLHYYHSNLGQDSDFSIVSACTKSAVCLIHYMDSLSSHLFFSYQ